MKKGSKHSAETIAKMGKSKSPKHRAAIGAALRLKYEDPAYRAKMKEKAVEMGLANRGREKTVEELERLRQTNLKPEIKAKRSEAVKKQWADNPGRRQRMSAISKALWEDPEYRGKMKNGAMTGNPFFMKGHLRSAETRARMAAGQRGRVLPPEVRAKISAAKKGKKPHPFSAETRAKMSASRLEMFARRRRERFVEQLGQPNVR